MKPINFISKCKLNRELHAYTYLSDWLAPSEWSKKNQLPRSPRSLPRTGTKFLLYYISLEYAVTKKWWPEAELAELMSDDDLFSSGCIKRNIQT